MEHLNETIQAIKDLDCIPNIKEWNEIAKKYNFLSAMTLKGIYKKNFYEICKEIRKKK